MNANRWTRRQFVAATSLGSLAAAAAQAVPASARPLQGTSKLAIKGGTPVRTKGFSGWPIWDKDHDEERVLAVLRSGVWSRCKVVAEFEKQYAELIGAKRCLATTHGTTALITALNALDIGVGDEVLVGPYTFIASVSVIFLAGALPIMVDTDRETFQVNPAQDGREDHAQHPGHSARSHLRPAGRYGPDQRDRQEAQPAGCGGRLSGVAGGNQRQEVRHARQPGLLQLPELQAPHLR